MKGEYTFSDENSIQRVNDMSKEDSKHGADDEELFKKCMHPSIHASLKYRRSKQYLQLNTETCMPA